MGHAASSFSIILACTFAAAQAAEPPEQALQVARKYSAAIAAFDCQAVAALTSPILHQAVQRANLNPQRWLCEYTEFLRSLQVHEVLGQPVQSVQDGAYSLVVFRAYRFSFNNDLQRDQVTFFNYLVHSSDAGRTWYVFDNGCANPKWLELVYPSRASAISLQSPTFVLLGE